LFFKTKENNQSIEKLVQRKGKDKKKRKRKKREKKEKKITPEFMARSWVS